MELGEDYSDAFKTNAVNLIQMSITICLYIIIYNCNITNVLFHIFDE
jgi:hypothetical protein